MASGTGDDGEAAPTASSPVVATANAAPPPKMDAGLLAAACSGSFQDLESLLNGRAAALSNGAIGSSAMQPPSPPGDVEAFFGESLRYGVTVGGDTLLHVVAASHYHREDFLNKARVIYSKAHNLLFVQNNMGDTPLHHAAGAGNFQMVYLLIDLAKGQDIDNVKVLLETENKLKETALHEAVRVGNNDMVKLFMEENPQLATIPKDGTSPLYLAISLENKIIAETLHQLSGGVLSYSGPNGQNALHVAVQGSQDFTKMLLEWNNDLTLQGDKNGNTPLHFSVVAVRWQKKRDRQPICSHVLKANLDALYQPDHNGSFPIHVAASVGATRAISDFLIKSPNCACLRDATGRTFLHVAVDKMEIKTVGNACRNRSLSWILNMQDKDGNTALHLAVRKGSLGMFCSLLGNRQVHLNLTNGKGKTPLDIAWEIFPARLYDNQNSADKILATLKYVGAKRGISRYIHKYDIEKAREDERYRMNQVKEATQSFFIVSVLIATVTFGATFAMPGGYIADDHTNAGSPTLAGTYSFGAFIVANTLAFALSVMATISLLYSGDPLLHLQRREMHLRRAYSLMSISVPFLVLAFAFGTSMMLAPVAPATAYLVYFIGFLIWLYQAWELTKSMFLFSALYKREGICYGIVWAFPSVALSFLVGILFQLCFIVVYLIDFHDTGGKVEPAAQAPTP